jgi:hypothetical protein
MESFGYLIEDLEYTGSFQKQDLQAHIRYFVPNFINSNFKEEFIRRYLKTLCYKIQSKLNIEDKDQRRINEVILQKLYLPDITFGDLDLNIYGFDIEDPKLIEYSFENEEHPTYRFLVKDINSLEDYFNELREFSERAVP